MAFLGYRVLADQNSRHPFDPVELGRFDRLRRLQHAGITPLPLTPNHPGAHST